MPASSHSRYRYRSIDRPTIIGLGLAGLAVLVQMTVYDRGIVPMDEGQLVTIADRLLHGEALYRDVYTGLFPGIYYLTALLFRVAGPDVVVTRWAQVAVNSATVLLLFHLARRATSTVWAVQPALWYLVLIPIGFPGLTIFNYSPLALLFSLAALCALLRYLDTGALLHGALAGALTAAALVVKQNFGAFCIVALALILCTCRRGTSVAERRLPAIAWPVVAGGTVVISLAVLPLIGWGAVGDFLRDTVFGILAPQLRSFNNPIPPVFGPHPVDDGRFTFLYLPPALLNSLFHGESFLGISLSPLVRSLVVRLSYGLALSSLLLAPIVLWATRSEASQGAQRTATALVVFAFLMFLGIFPSAIWPHLAFVSPPLFLLVAVAAGRIDRVLGHRCPTGKRVWRLSWATILLCGCAAGTVAASGIRRWHPVPLLNQRASLFVSPERASLLRSSTQFLRKCAAPGEPVFIAPTMPILYFLSERRNPTPYDLTIPGDVRENVIVGRLSKTGTRCVVFDPHMYIEFPPFADIFPSLNRYLREAYTPVATFQAGGSSWQALARRDGRRRE